LDFNIDFNLVRTQKLLLIPQLKQALDILEMSFKEMLQFIEDQLGSNPALEKAHDTVIDGLTEESPDYTGDEQDGYILDEPAETISLKDHLLNQLNVTGLDKCSYKIGEYLIDSTDDNGYITVDTSEVASFFNVPEAKVLSVLGKLQGFDPPGICARNLKECLIIQLQQLDEKDEDAIIIVKRFLDELASDDVESVAEAMKIPTEKVRKIFNRVKSLEPRPGREFFRHETANPVIPDIIVSEAADGFRVLYNDEEIPDICVSESFTGRQEWLDEREAQEFVRDKVKNAVWFIKCLEQRKNILTSIGQKLCAEVPEFFINGPKAFEPWGGLKTFRLIDRSKFAALLDMHETVLDKAVDGKYLQCRWGLFEIGSFFTRPEKLGEDLIFI